MLTSRLCSLRTSNRLVSPCSASACISCRRCQEEQTCPIWRNQRYQAASLASSSPLCVCRARPISAPSSGKISRDSLVRIPLAGPCQLSGGWQASLRPDRRSLPTFRCVPWARVVGPLSLTCVSFQPADIADDGIVSDTDDEFDSGLPGVRRHSMLLPFTCVACSRIRRPRSDHAGCFRLRCGLVPILIALLVELTSSLAGEHSYPGAVLPSHRGARREAGYRICVAHRAS